MCVIYETNRTKNLCPQFFFVKKLLIDTPPAQDPIPGANGGADA